RVYFVNSIVILNKENEAEEESSVKPRETKEEEEDDSKHFNSFPTMKELRYHEWLLKNPRPPWVKAKIKTGNVNNVKFSCMIGQRLDTTSVINHYLGSVVFGKPFMKAIGLVYNKEKGMIVFERDKERIIFKMTHKMDMFKHLDFADRGTDNILLSS
nr:hypothetical protein [Tanacetum cinerariifolium]